MLESISPRNNAVARRMFIIIRTVLIQITWVVSRIKHLLG